jgi:hypothetical protein
MEIGSFIEWLLGWLDKTEWAVDVRGVHKLFKVVNEWLNEKVNEWREWMNSKKKIRLVCELEIF